jgi:hypothetical protein
VVLLDSRDGGFRHFCFDLIVIASLLYSTARYLDALDFGNWLDRIYGKADLTGNKYSGYEIWEGTKPTSLDIRIDDKTHEMSTRISKTQTMNMSSFAFVNLFVFDLNILPSFHTSS